MRRAAACAHAVLTISSPLCPNTTTTDSSWAADAPAHFYARFPRFEATGLYLAVYGALVALFTGMLLTRDSVFNVWAIR